MSVFVETRPTIASCRQQVERVLSKQKEEGLTEGINPERLSSELIHCVYQKQLGKTISRQEWLHFEVLDSQRPISHESVQLLEAWLLSLAKGVPVQYLTKQQGFLNHDYFVNEAVLIPRPETETWVVQAIQKIKNENLLQGLELGLGSGAISLELLSAIPKLLMKASEVSKEAIEVAKENRSQILGQNSQRLEIVRAKDPLDIFEPFFEQEFFEKVDFVISNPPYVASSQEMQEQVFRYEPHLALIPKSPNPSYFYEQIIGQALRVLKENGFLFLEIPHERAEEIGVLFGSEWKWEFISDLNGRLRAIFARHSLAKEKKNG